MRAHQLGSRDEAGFTALALVFMLVPLLLVVGSQLHTMTGRNQRLLLEVREEQAMLSAEAGLDIALHEARRGVLVAGVGATFKFEGTLPSGSSYEAECVYLRGDSVDNDGDGSVDEADEDVFRVITTGQTLTCQRRVAAYLGFTSYMPALNGAVTITNPSTTIAIGGAARVRGENYALNGTTVGSGDAYGLSIMPPGTTADLNGELTGGERTAVTGTGGTPSLGVAPVVDVDELVAFARNGANVVLTNGTLSGGTFGSTTSPKIVYRSGNIRIQGNTTGYGLLVVDGDMDIRGTFRWYGAIICTGVFECGSGTAQLYGGALLGSLSDELDLRGTIDMRYSSAGLALASAVLGRYVAFNGWQEISTN